jgi:hypothetical protein
MDAHAGLVDLIAGCRGLGPRPREGSNKGWLMGSWLAGWVDNGGPASLPGQGPAPMDDERAEQVWGRLDDAQMSSCFAATSSLQFALALCTYQAFSDGYQFLGKNWQRCTYFIWTFSYMPPACRQRTRAGKLCRKTDICLCTNSFKYSILYIIYLFNNGFILKKRGERERAVVSRLVWKEGIVWNVLPSSHNNCTSVV